MDHTLLEMQNITKKFLGATALENVQLTAKKGEIHALVGENGAGKSTLMKVLSGVHPYGSYEGEILFNQELCKFKSINDSEEKGIVIIHQELALIPELSIAENIFLGNEQSNKNIINWNTTTMKTKELLNRVGLNSNPGEIVKNIGVGRQQLVEIAKAISKNVKLLILDEPTASLNEEDSENLLNLLVEFRKQGITCILISHKLQEITKVADQLTILRDGQSIETLSFNHDNVNEQRIIKGMVGRDLSSVYPERSPKIGEKAFEIRNWVVYHPQQSDNKIINNANLHLNQGEITGIAGLMGAGRTELAMSIFGKSYGKKISGTMIKGEKEIHLKNVSEAIKNGIAYVSENRKEHGLILIDDVKNNLTLSNLSKISRKSVINQLKEVQEAEKLRQQMNVKSRGLEQKVQNLSGGNQQKVILGKWLFIEPDILILDEPTRGIDVGAKFEIYKIISDLADSGKSILIISSELPEITGMCDRIYTLSAGNITGEFTNEESNQELLMEYMTKEIEGT